MPAGYTILDWRTMTAAVNEIRTDNNFLQTLLFGNHVPYNTETIAIEKWLGTRKMAPFVKKNGEAILVSGVQKSFAEVQPPNIRLKLPMNPAQYGTTRTPGSGIFVGEGEQRAAISNAMGKDLTKLKSYVAENIEWLVAQALTGKITYTTGVDPGEGDSFEIDFQRNANFTVTLTSTAQWDDTTPLIIDDFENAMELMNANGHTANIAIMGKNAAKLFKRDSKVLAALDNRRLEAGEINLRRPYLDSGARFLGNLNSIDCWVYGRSTLDPSGNAAQFINDNHVFFIANAPGSEMELGFGAIYDYDADETTGLFVGEMFSKQWLEKDPSGMMNLIHSRPLPIMRRPECVYQLIVT